MKRWIVTGAGFRNAKRPFGGGMLPRERYFRRKEPPCACKKKQGCRVRSWSRPELSCSLGASRSSSVALVPTVEETKAAADKIKANLKKE